MALLQLSPAAPVELLELMQVTTVTRACVNPPGNPPLLIFFPQAMGTELQSKKFLLSEAEQNLQRTKTCSNTLASKFQEHCPDIERQEAELYKLNQRFNNLSKQIDHR